MPPAEAGRGGQPAVVSGIQCLSQGWGHGEATLRYMSESGKLTGEFGVSTPDGEKRKGRKRKQDCAEGECRLCFSPKKGLSQLGGGGGTALLSGGEGAVPLSFLHDWSQTATSYWKATPEGRDARQAALFNQAIS